MPSTVVKRVNLISTPAAATHVSQHVQLQVYFRAMAKTGTGVSMWVSGGVCRGGQF